MKELQLTDIEAQQLITLLKVIATKHNKTLTNNTSGHIDIVGQNHKRFILNYFYSTNSKVFHLRETEHNYTLIRINLNNKFHKNANGEKIWGNRINIFSEEEYYLKADESTHYKAYPLPYETIKDTNDFLEMMSNLFDYTNINNPQDANINIQEDLI
ncbi:TPA: hypothetical protein TUM56_000265 [Streptococcus equi subsp. zooepidemicus]|uniref:DUF6978 family protein n=1 Tax=Streptococcus equi TaxID=1336 RepID=UPI0005BE5EE5|nr:hypothetical protein [Streptococcus equi]KIS13265.1 hypothetical protein AT50_00368 [Streptococcus equi subsp. zooepidemicus Sz105]QBX15589.1 hypothetical protein Javan197_0003 [Streptococcus phage Javan197]QBX24485.1 hypothetical protein Javan190_0003 [Streptococcus phage Javan190]QBX24539.1 hypothetical protein Javan192_0003 [Streptococcus phage Javan192]MCD3410334.1 hypothetical protein [Streptococcus equi subsp. zooepidemicus]